MVQSETDGGVVASSTPAADGDRLTLDRAWDILARFFKPHERTALDVKESPGAVTVTYNGQRVTARTEADLRTFVARVRGGDATGLYGGANSAMPHATGPPSVA